MPSNKDVIVIYTRKSKFTGKGESIENQAELCRDYIRLHYGAEYAEGAKVYEDEGYSGGNLNRPEFKQMMEEIRNREYKAVVVYRLDRISRSIGDFAKLIEELDKLGVDFVSIREQFDTQSPMGRAMMYIASVFSQLERETIAERIRDNMHELAKTGRWLGGTTPTGYRSEPIVVGKTEDGKERKAFKLTVIPEEAEIVQLIFSRFLEYDSLTKVEAELLQKRIKTKRGKEFTRFAIKGILQNPVYLIADEAAYRYFNERNAEIYSDLFAFDGEHGIAAYNRTDQVKGKTNVIKPVNEWIVSVGRHQGLIPAEAWIKVQESLEKNKSKNYRKPRSHEALLTGMLYCHCGSRMYPKVTTRVTAEGEKIYTYMCLRKDRSRKALCDCRNANGNTLDIAIIQQLKQLGEDKSEFTRQLEQSRKLFAESHTEYEQALKELRAELKEAEAKLPSLVDSLTEMNGKEARARVSERIEELGTRIEENKRRISELEGLSQQNALSDAEFDTLRRMLLGFSSMVDEMTLDQKRQMMRGVVQKVIWDGENVQLYLFGAEGDVELPEIPDGTPNNKIAENVAEDGELLIKCKDPAEEAIRWGGNSK
ncbi:MAG: recombinase family protein [Oscillospiraceae bacterium]|nr:recombinase family protein [Oscillospiraceae bacterium]